jgi:membrane-associated phospholipid phosphatase
VHVALGVATLTASADLPRLLMYIPISIALAILTAVSLLFETRGARTTLQLHFRGDLRRESAFLAQYGQGVCTFFCAWLVAASVAPTPRSWAAWRAFILIFAPVMLAAIACMTLKRVFGRIRPNRENAGKFTGFSWRHDNERESFPSSHSAGGVALTIALINAWPQAAIIFWLLAVIVALLRYLLDAHFPSDVLAGCLLGLVISHAAVTALESLLPRA